MDDGFPPDYDEAFSLAFYESLEPVDSEDFLLSLEECIDD